MYASTLFFTFSVKLSRVFFFWHAFNFYLQRASSHTSLHREKTFPAAPPSPGSSSVPCSKGCPMLPSCAGPRDAALPHIPRRRETNPSIPRAPGLSWYLQLPEKTATLSPYPMEWGWGYPSTDTACRTCGVSIFLKKKIKVAHCTFRKPCRSSVLYTSKTSMVPALALLTMGVKGQLHGEKNGQGSHERKCR